jgi:hypothetical protein
VKKNLCAVNSQLLYPENDFNSIQKIAAKQVFFRGSGSVQRQSSGALRGFIAQRPLERSVRPCIHCIE